MRFARERNIVAGLAKALKNYGTTVEPPEREFRRRVLLAACVESNM